MLFETIISWLIDLGIPPVTAQAIEEVMLLSGILILAILANWLTRRYLVWLIEILFKKSANKWDDALLRHDFSKRFAHLVPLLVVYLLAGLLYSPQSISAVFIMRTAMVLFVIAGIRVLDSLLGAIRDIYAQTAIGQGKSIRSYTDAVKILAYMMAVVFIVAIVTGRSPWGILSVLGGFTVVLMLVFKDTILGFVASLQLSGHDMVRVGDWIEMPSYGADGDVFDVSIHTVKVRNWDKTITTIPTYALVSNAFKNWRGMTESGGRRIKRALNIDMTSIRFCSAEMLERFRKLELLREYLRNKQEEIDTYNREQGFTGNELINGRRQTNIGVFRAYVIAYLRNHPKINQEMTFLVRHLEPTSTGLPIQIYVFSSDQIWAHYEALQADIFDHLLAAMPFFDLRVFQNPTGHDFSDWCGRKDDTNMTIS